MRSLGRSIVGGFLFALLATSPSQAANKQFKRDDLSDAAIKLEAQIKSRAASVSKPAATLRAEADAAFRRNDLGGGLNLLELVAASAPERADVWLNLSRKIIQSVPSNHQRRTALMEQASTAAYIAYQRAGNAGEEAEALGVLGEVLAVRRLWRPALNAYAMSLDLRETPAVRGAYEKLREEHGFRLLDYSVDSDAASPRACFQFSEKLAQRFDFSPFITQAGNDKPAITVEDAQLCIDGLKHGDRYTINLRSGLPSQVRETLPKSAEFNIYVRDRKPFVRFTGKAYVLPRTGQSGIPLVSVNTQAVKLEAFRIGDRNLISTVIGNDFQTNLSDYSASDLGETRGTKIWSGEVVTQQTLNQDVTTAVPVDEMVGTLEPGVYVMTAKPAGPVSSEHEAGVATQWFIVSDLGISAFSGNDGIHVFVNSLATTVPVGGADVRLLARNNEILATRKLDAAGHVLFESGLARGTGGLEPALVTVSRGNEDYAFLSLKASAFDLSDRGVSGRIQPAGADGFIYAERGVYRSGETVYLTALLRDGRGDALAGPVTIVIERPDGVEYRRTQLQDQGAGGRSLALPLNRAVMSGTWRARMFTDPKGKPVGETTFMVEDYVPDRIEFTLDSSAKSISADAPAELRVDGRFLYGAPASSLELEGDVLVTEAKSRAGYDGYKFGVPSDGEASTEREALADLPQTDEKGVARFPVGLPKAPEEGRLYEAQLFIRMVENGGRAVERKLTLPVKPSGPMIGVKALFDSANVSAGARTDFDVVVVSPDGTSLARSDLRYELMQIESRYQWFRHGAYWDYEPVKTTKRVADGQLNVAADKPARISLSPSTGRYRLDVRSADADGPVTSYQFDVGWFTDGSADTPDLLETSIDKPSVKAGETISVSVNAPSGGLLTVNVLGDRLLATKSVDVKAGTTQVAIPVGTDWGTGAYVVATLRRPLDTVAKRMPSRAIGVKWFAIDRAQRTLQVSLGASDLVRPGTSLNIPVKVEGLNAGEDAKVVLAAVDVGILNLTGYKPPAPDDFYLGQKRLTAEIRDIYGQLIDGMQGTRGQLRSGGDIAAIELQGSPPSQKPLAFYSGILTVGPDGTANVAFDLPEFAGTARLMAIAWTATKLGRAQADVTIRDSVVLTATLPRFLLNGDQSSLRLDLDNVEGEAGDYTVKVAATGPVRLSGNSSSAAKLAKKQRISLSVPIAATSATGAADVRVDITGPNGVQLARNYAVNVKPATQTLVRRTVRTLAKGESITLTGDLFSDIVGGTGTMSVSVGLSSALDAASALKALDRYPYGCTEQITSRALPLLYANDLAAAANLALDVAADERIRDAIERVLARQASNGSFGLWTVGGSDPWLNAYVTDFLTRAREKGHAVPDVAFRSALDHIRNEVVNAEEPEKTGGSALAYGLYVLARNGVAPVGDLRYLADTKLSHLKTPISKAQLAAALALIGDKARADRVYTEGASALSPRPALQTGREDYGSQLRDASAYATLASEGNAPRPILMTAVQRIEAARALTDHQSTQDLAWLVLATRAVAKESASLIYTLNGEALRAANYRNYRADAVTASPVTLTNMGETPLQAVTSVSGSPVSPEPAVSNGFKIERSYHSLDGEPMNIARVKQNERIAVVLKITEGKPENAQVMIADYLPAGFEIDNPRLVSSGDSGTLGWIADGVEAAHTEFRDDRFTAAIDRKANSRPQFTVAYVVRAVSPGKYVLPQASVEDMYSPARFARTGTGTVEVVAGK